MFTTRFWFRSRRVLRPVGARHHVTPSYRMISTTSDTQEIIDDAHRRIYIQIYLVVDGEEHEASGIDMEMYTMEDDGSVKILTTSNFGPEVSNLNPAKINKLARLLPGVREVQRLPIFNLISTIRPNNNARLLLEIRDRLSWNSIIIATQLNFGVLEELCGSVFKDPAQRPTFRIAAVSKGLWYAQVGTQHIDEFEKIMKGKGQRTDSTKLRVATRGIGAFDIGPIVPRNVPRMDERQKWAQYLVNTLLQVPAFQAQEVDQAKSISRRTFRMAPTAILGPLSVLKDCKIKDVLREETTKTIAAKMLQELWNVMRHEWKRYPLQFHHLAKIVDKHIEFNPEFVHSWVLDVAQGRNTDIDAINGCTCKEITQLLSCLFHKADSHYLGLVNRGELIGEPCPTYKAVIELVKKKTEENRMKEEAKEAALEAKQDFGSISPEREPKGEPSEDEIYGPEKLEKRRMEKLARQRENFGKLPLPESYVRPEIRPFGGARRVRG